MDYWTENQGHLPPCSKFNTLPSRSYTQNYHDRPPPPQYQVYCEEQRGKVIDSGYYWPPKDTTNWSNQESTAPLQFPFNLDHRIQHYQGEQRQEPQDWTTYQHQERGIQHEGWSYNPVHYKRELSKKNDNNFRELEAWALRYSHSLPRRRRIEAELRGAMQDNVERREMQMANGQESMLRDRASRQQAVNYHQTAHQSQNLDVKDKINYQTKLYNHPPNYNAPPSYNVQYRSVLTQQTLPKQSYELPQVVKKTEKELYKKVVAKGLDSLQERQQVQRRSSSDAAKIIEGRKFLLNKKAGGMTIFCLVSRIADTEPENVPISQKQNKVPKDSNVSESSKLADEVDFKIQTSTKHARSPYSKLQAIPICKESLSKMADKNLQKSNDVSEIGKLAVRFPLWRRPSFTSSVDTENASTTYCSDILESNLQDREKDSKPGSKIDTESQGVCKKDGDATLIIDTTCVIVKMELLKAPKKEHVHYLSSEDQTKTGQMLANETAQCNEEISIKQQDTGQIEEFEMLAEQANSKDVVEGTKSEDFSPTNSETLEECAKRICGLRNSKPQQEDNFDFAVEELGKQNKETNELKANKLDQKKLLNVSSVSKNKNSQEMKSTEIGDVEKSNENITEDNSNNFKMDNELQKFKMANRLEQDLNLRSGQYKASVGLRDSIDISNTLELGKQGWDNNILQFPNENLEDVALKLPVSDLNKHKKDATQQILTAVKVENVSENIFILDSQDQDVKKEVNERSSDVVEKPQNCNVGELNWPVSIEKEKYIPLSELEMHEKTIVQDTAINNLLHFDSSQIKVGPTLEKFENEQNKSAKLTETANVKLYACNMDSFKSVPKVISCIKKVDDDKDIEVATSPLEIEEKGIETINEMDKSIAIVDASTDKEQSDAMEQELEHSLVASNENGKDFEQEIEKDLKEQFGSRDKACSNEERLITNIEEPVISINVQDHQEIEPTTVTDPQGQLLSEDVEQNTEKEGEYMNKIDITELLGGQKDVFSVDVNYAMSSDLEMQKYIQLNDVTEFGQEKRSNCVKLYLNTEFGEEEFSECVNLNDDIEFGQEECSDCVKLNDDTEFGQKESANCTKEEVDHLDLTRKEGVVKDTDSLDLKDKEEKEEIIVGASCARLRLEMAGILVEDGEPVNEPEKTKDIDSKEYVLCEIGKIDVSDRCIYDSDLQQCQWDDAIVDSNVIKDGLDVIDTEKRFQISKSEVILQPQVHLPDEDFTDSGLNCQPGSIANTNAAAILERSCTSMDNLEQSPSTSTCENVYCEEEGKYPKSLWDAVNRIRKHTAPDSENEEEEITDNWDRESSVSVENVFENIMGYVDCMQSGQCYEDLNVQDDTFSQCSNSSQESDGTIVDDDLEETEITNAEVYNEDRSNDGEEQGQNAAQNEETINQNQTEEFPQGLSAEMAENIML